MTPNELELYIAHELQYFRFGGDVSIRDYGWFLRNDQLAGYHDINRVMHLRDDGRGPSEICQEIIAHFNALHRRVVVDVDATAERQGFGAVLRSMAVLPVSGAYVAMRWNNETCDYAQTSNWTVREIDGEVEAHDWNELAGCDESGSTERRFWCEVGRMECRYPSITKLGAFAADGEMVAACTLFIENDWARIDSVIVKPQFRRRRVASALVSVAIRRAVAAGCRCIYLDTERDGVAQRLYQNLGFVAWAVNPMRRHMSD